MKCLSGGISSGVFARLHLRHHRLDDHNGVVNDGSNGQHQGE